MKISVALCTLNGEKFLRTQLSSLVDQTLPPDEVIVCDEGSSDRTMLILDQFKDRLPLQIHQNPTRLGTYQNFQKALKLCTGDYIFPADQDDFWDPQKIERIATYFNHHEDTEVVFTDAVLVDEFGQISDKRLWSTFRFREEQQRDWKLGKSVDILLNGNRVTGCTMGVRKRFLDRITPFPTNLPSYFLHDAWMGLAAALENKIDFIPATYVQYRLHSEQQVGVKGNQGTPPTLWERMQRPHEDKVGPYRKKLEFLIELRHAVSEKFPNQRFEPLDTRIDYWDRRANLPKARWKRLKKTIQNLILGNYHRYKDIDAPAETPYLMFLGDLIE
ncbi:glycosyltransferase [Aquirufa sp.]|uniref:glycosyltransferase n=1 Tax=Aquirufa sp. TaxID=2676249 RepID=UPI0037BF1EAD